MTTHRIGRRIGRFVICISPLLIGAAGISPLYAQGTGTSAGAGTMGAPAGGSTATTAAPNAGSRGNSAPGAGPAGTSATTPGVTQTSPATPAVAPATGAPAAQTVGPGAVGSAAQTTTPSPGSPGTVTGPPLTIDQAIAFGLDNNTNIALAEQRLAKAKELIKQAYALALPQISAQATDTLSSIKTFGTVPATVSSLTTIPGGGQIPTITDQPGANGGISSSSTGGGSITSSGGAGTTGGLTGSGSNLTSPAQGVGTPAPVTFTPPVSNSGVNPASPSPSSGGGASGSSSSTSGAGPVTSQARPQLADAHATEQPAASGGNGNGNSGNFQGKNNNYGARLSITQGIDLFGFVPAGLDVERRTRAFYEVDLQRIENETALAIKVDFYAVLADQEAVAADQEQVNAAAENYRISEVEYQNQVAAEFNVLSAKTALANAQQALSAAQTQVNIAQANMNSILGRSLDTPINLQAPPVPPLDLAIDLPGGVQTAYQNRPEMKQANNNIEIAKRLIKLDTATLTPSIGIGGSASAGTGQTTEYDLSATINVPLYDGGATASRVRSAQIDLQAQQTTRDQLMQNIALEVRQAYLSAINARDSIATATDTVATAEEALRLANLRYQNGVGTYLDVSNALAQLATSQQNLITAQFNYQTSLAELLRAEGGR